jgi:hypothetical protein
MNTSSKAILALKPVTFDYKSDQTGTPQYGLIAEEVDKVNPDLVLRDEQGKPYTVRYDAVNAMLLNEFLKEHRTVQESGVVRGFVRFSDGSFSAPIVDPNDTVGFTEGRGINNPRTVVGDYVISDGTVHSFLLSGGTFTEYDLPGALQTNLLGINEPGDLTGTFDPGNGVFQAFIDRGGTITSYSVPGAVATLAYEMNNNKKLTVGYFVDGSGVLHGQYRDANGALHFPIDPSGSVATVLFGLNNRNWVVGRYADAAGVTHGLFFVPPDRFFTFDFPGSTFTSLNGISSQGNIIGRYVDASGIAHGFIARVRGTPPTTPAGPEMKANASRSLLAPLNTSSAAWGGAMPAR